MIQIKLDKAIDMPGEYSFFISFPYMQDAVNFFKKRALRRWHKNLNAWEFPIT